MEPRLRTGNNFGKNSADGFVVFAGVFAKNGRREMVFCEQDVVKRMVKLVIGLHVF
jgi:hypothetical protein